MSLALALAAAPSRDGAWVGVAGLPELGVRAAAPQAAVPVRAGDTEAALAARVLDVEHRIYPQALRSVAEGRVRIVDGRCLIDGQPAAIDRR